VANNPLEAARAEVKQLFPGTRLPDYVISFGTGRFQENASSWSFLQPILRRWFFRLITATLRKIDPEVMYSIFSQNLYSEEQSRYHRLNPSFPVPAVKLDDGKAVHWVQRLVKDHLTLDQDMISKLRRAQIAMLSSLFYLVICSPPVFESDSGLYKLTISIVCRWEDDETVSKELSDLLSDAFFSVQSIHYRYDTPLFITLTVPSLTSLIHVELQQADDDHHVISGLPASVEQLLYLQGTTYRLRAQPGCKKRGWG
jgi:hypothetical protein